MQFKLVSDELEHLQRGNQLPGCIVPSMQTVDIPCCSGRWENQQNLINNASIRRTIGSALLLEGT